MSDHAIYILKHWIKLQTSNVKMTPAQPVWLNRDFTTAKRLSLTTHRLGKLGFGRIIDFFDEDGRLVRGKEAVLRGLDRNAWLEWEGVVRLIPQAIIDTRPIGTAGVRLERELQKRTSPDAPSAKRRCTNGGLQAEQGYKLSLPNVEGPPMRGSLVQEARLQIGPLSMAPKEFTQKKIVRAVASGATEEQIQVPNKLNNKILYLRPGMGKNI